MVESSENSPTNDYVSQDDYNKQRRTVEINVYYEKKYASYLDVLKYFTFYCIILLILAILRKRMILSYSFTNILTMVLVIVGGMHLYLKIADINMRDNMDFDEYDWSFNPENQSDPNKIDTNLHDVEPTGATCVEESCCNTPTTKWCASSGKCVLPNSLCPDDGRDIFQKSTSCDEYNSKKKCKDDTSGDYYCPINNECISSDDPSDCACTDGKVWCPYEGVCKDPVGNDAGCKTNPCNAYTVDIQAEKVGVSNSNSCNLLTGDDHNNCLHNHTQGEHFISGIFNTFSSFKKSMNPVKFKEKKHSNIKAFSQLDNNYSPV
jgi:hypothetical protein